MVEPKDDKPPPRIASKGILGALASFMSRPVPHGWFLHYYTTSVGLSIFWGLQLATRGRVFRSVAELGGLIPKCTSDSMFTSQVWLVWGLMAFQGARRLTETIAFSKPSHSTMPVFIYIVGIAYYVFVSVAVWIEGRGWCNSSSDSLCAMFRG